MKWEYSSKYKYVKIVLLYFSPLAVILGPSPLTSQHTPHPFKA